MKNFIKRFLRAIFVLITSVLSLPFLLVTLLVSSIILLFDNDGVLTIKERFGAFYRGVWYGLLLRIDYIKYGGYEAVDQLRERLES